MLASRALLADTEVQQGDWVQHRIHRGVGLAIQCCNSRIELGLVILHGGLADVLMVNPCFLTPEYANSRVGRVSIHVSMLFVGAQILHCCMKSVNFLLLRVVYVGVVCCSRACFLTSVSHG